MDRIVSFFGDHLASFAMAFVVGACAILLGVAAIRKLGRRRSGGIIASARVDGPVDTSAPMPPPGVELREIEESTAEAGKGGHGQFRPHDFDLRPREDFEDRLKDLFREGPALQPESVNGADATAQQEVEREAGKEVAARYINLAFMRSDEVVAWQRSLAPETEYHLRFDIGAFADDRIPDGREVAFPFAALPSSADGHWLDVVAASRDFAVGKAKSRVFLPKSGRSWVCDCNPRDAHHCAPQNRKQYLLIPVTSPPRPGNAELRVGVYFKNNLLQACLVKTNVASTDADAVAQSMTTDYTLNGTLTEVGKLETKKINILADKIVGGEQGFIINGAIDQLVTFRLSEGQLSDAAKAARQRLRDIHLKEESTLFGGKRLVNKFDKNNGKSKADFIEDLRRTSPLGYLLWTTLFQAQPELRRSLRDDVLREPAAIQIARASTNFVFPWGLVYDIRLETEESKHTVCRVVEEWQDGKGLPVEGMYACPYRADHTVNTLCPFGFWGFRHSIEQPPSVGPANSLASEIRVTAPPARLFVCASSDLDSEYTAPHLTAIRSLKFGFEACTTKQELLKRLKTVDPGVVYIYCHGGRTHLAGSNGSTPFLSIGAGEKLTPGDVLAALDDESSELYWSLATPLIFINGCHTAELTPDVLVNFVDTFAGLSSSGVIGTEVTVHQLLANEVGAEFLQRFETESVGETLRRMRNRLLCKGNLMGLAYSAYCLSALRIAATARHMTADTLGTSTKGG